MQQLAYYIDQTLEYWQGKLALGAVLSSLMAFFGVDQLLVLCLFWLMIADLALGLFRSFKQKTFSHQILKRGIIKYPLYCTYLLMVGVINIAFSHAFDIGLPLLDIFLAYMIFNEVASMLKHMESMGIKIPPLLKILAIGGVNRVEQEVKEKIGVPDEPAN
jgi:toxin secretion/phage lysis holin